MFSYFKGLVAEVTESAVVVECGGIGYELLASAKCLNMCKKGEQIKLPAYLQVKDDGVALFGFFDKAEKEMFLRLISISGVGPKLAVTVLGSLSPSDIARCAATKDIATLNKVKGIGKKTAERIILELKDKISLEIGEFVANGESMSDIVQIDNDAVLALISLGFSKAEAASAVSKIKTDGLSAEQIVLEALKR